MKRHLVLAMVALSALGGAACGATKPAREDGAAHAVATRTAMASAASVAPPTTEKKAHQHRHRLRLTSCDSNIKVNGATTTCAFAENVFYEYWKAFDSGDGSAIAAYSPASGRTYELRCAERTLISCRADDGSYVAFPAAAVDRYDADQAAKYACAADLGPSEGDACPDAKGTRGGQDPAGTSGDCDPNYAGACLDPTASDYDCEGGSGNGPDYTGPVEVVGDDHYGLDRDGDGIGCEDLSNSTSDPSTDYAPDAPTTDDFGSGSGSVGQCADGTLSDSIGRPGACSHHGGVG
jgi:hypothetical protein